MSETVSTRSPLVSPEVKRAGHDATIVAYSKMLLLALEAADQLSREGIEVEVIDPRTLKPLDLPTIVASVKKTGRLVIVEEGWRFLRAGRADCRERVSRRRSTIWTPPSSASPAKMCRCPIVARWKMPPSRTRHASSKPSKHVCGAQ